MSAYVPASEYQGGSMNDGIRSSTNAPEMTMNHRCSTATRQIEGARDGAAARVAEKRPCTDVAIRPLSVHRAGLLERRCEYSGYGRVAGCAGMKSVTADPIGVQVRHLALRMQVHQDRALPLCDLRRRRVVRADDCVQCRRRRRRESRRACDARRRVARTAIEIHRQAIEIRAVGNQDPSRAASPQGVDKLIKLTLVLRGADAVDDVVDVEPDRDERRLNRECLGKLVAQRLGRSRTRYSEVVEDGRLRQRASEQKLRPGVTGRIDRAYADAFAGADCRVNDWGRLVR